MSPTFFVAPTKNFIQKTLSGSINAAVTTITLSSTTDMQAPGYIVVDRVDSAGTATPTIREVITYTGISGSDITGCTRGADGSTAQSHADQAIVETVPTVGMWNSLTTIVASGLDSNGYLKGIASPVSIAVLQSTSVFTSGITIITSINASGASVVGFTNSAKSFIPGMNNGAISFGQTLYVYPPGEMSGPFGTEASRQTAWDVGTFNRLSFRVTLNTLNNDAFITLRKNGANTSLAKTVSSTATGVFSTTINVSSAADDLISLQINTTSCASGAITIHSPSLTFTAT